MSGGVTAEVLTVPWQMPRDPTFSRPNDSTGCHGGNHGNFHDRNGSVLVLLDALDLFVCAAIKDAHLLTMEGGITSESETTGIATLQFH